ncbi:hypothetical protein M885DRAFT_504456 [Pelagophyceae sp. CCMP2097]|nr:hypothetical protein M885DRAFT_504456 [Pelagophyceae sp. CCMP2097]
MTRLSSSTSSVSVSPLPDSTCTLPMRSCTRRMSIGTTRSTVDAQMAMPLGKASHLCSNISLMTSVMRAFFVPCGAMLPPAVRSSFDWSASSGYAPTHGCSCMASMSNFDMALLLCDQAAGTPTPGSRGGGSSSSGSVPAGLSGAIDNAAPR